MRHFTLILIFFSSILGNTHIVDQMGNGDFLNINDAKINSNDNDTIQVRAGYYIERLTFNSSAPSLVIVGAGMDVCTIFYSDEPVRTVSYSGVVVIEGFAINWGGASGIGVAIAGGDITLQKCRVAKTNLSDNYSNGIMINTASSTINIKNCIVTMQGNASGRSGIQISNANNSTVTISNSIMYGSTYGVVYSASNADCFLYNNIIINNDIGVSLSGGTNIVAMYNNVFGNSTNYTNDFVPGDGDISSDPLFHNLNNGDFRLGAGSPCFDAGAPWQMFNDVDGSRNDMGIYGGPQNIGGLGPIITNIQSSAVQIEQGGIITIQATGTVD
jgi:hypothetical protein